MSSPIPASNSGVSTDLGPVLGGIYVSARIFGVLWGVLTLQLFHYFIRYPKDKLGFKLMVIAFWVMLTLQFYCLLRPEYDTLIKYWGNPAGLLKDKTSPAYDGLLAALINALAQCFFTYRLYFFSKRNIWFPIVFVPLILGQLATGSVVVYFGFHRPFVDQQADDWFRAPEIASNTFPVAIDTGLTVFMIYWLLKEAQGIKGTHAMIVKLVMLTIISGFWTAAAALASLITSIVCPLPIYAAVNYVLAPLYCNSVLANLNARDFIRDRSQSEIAFGSELRFTTNPNHTRQNGTVDSPPQSTISLPPVFESSEANTSGTIQDRGSEKEYASAAVYPVASV